MKRSEHDARPRQRFEFEVTDTYKLAWQACKQKWLLRAFAKAQINSEKRVEERHVRLQPCDWRPPIRFLEGLERAHRGEQERKRQDELDNLAQNSDNDGVEIELKHRSQLLKDGPYATR